MLQLLTNVTIADNSGATKGQLIKVLKPKNSKVAKLGRPNLPKCIPGGPKTQFYVFGPGPKKNTPKIVCYLGRNKMEM